MFKVIALSLSLSFLRPLPFWFFSELTPFPSYLTFSQELAVCVVFFAVVFAAPAQDEAPSPYEFNFQEKNENHTLARQESGDAQGVVRGSYQLIDRDGRTRTVNYVADDDGFRAEIQSNEPGLISSAPAAATYNVQ